jgi:mannitol/fructose-specific phosphotransferase system IIA component (Ntr-type)
MIIQMGPKPSLFAAGLIMIGVIWFFAYANKRISRGGAIFHVFERLGQRRFDGLDQELRGILKERGLKSTDLFDEIIATAQVIDAEEGAEFEQVTRQAADRLARATELPAGLMAQGFLDGTRVGATPVSRGVALPHIRLAGIDRPFLVIVRSRFGLSVCSGEAISETDARTVNAVFYLASPSEDPAVHLRLLAQLASCVEQEGFMNEWLSARTHETIREVLLRDDRYLTIMLRPDTPAEVLIDCPIREVAFPSDSLIAIVRRGSHTLIPQAGMVLRAGDRLTVLGESKGIAELSAWVAGESEWRARSDSAENNDTAAE